MPEIAYLSQVDPDDIDDILPLIEKSFNIEFHQTELSNVFTFGHLCDLVAAKIDFPQVDDCTSQQAFYRLRQAIANVQGLEVSLLHPDTTLASVFPINVRRRKFRQLDLALGFHADALIIAPWVIGLWLLAVLLSAIMMFVTLKFGLTGIVLCYIYWRAMPYFELELKYETIGDLSKYLSATNYLNLRRNPGSINRQEIEAVIRHIFTEKLFVDVSVLTREASFA